MLRYSVLLLFLLSMASCQDNMVYTSYTSLSNGSWKEKDTVRFEFSPSDTAQAHNIYINVRNNDEYPFSNLFLIAEMNRPNGETVVDTLEYEMAMPDGTWLGMGRGSIKESKLWYRENVVFRDSGVYTFKVSHAMRKNGKVNGIKSLLGITDIGLEIEQYKLP